MMSKNSFLVNMKENNKRRIWVWVISILCFVLAYPVGVALMIKQAQTNLDWIKAEYGAAAESILQSRLLENVKYMMGTSFILMGCCLSVAVFMTQRVISQTCYIIAGGALCSVLLTIFLLPAVTLLLDRFLVRGKRS